MDIKTTHTEEDPDPNESAKSLAELSANGAGQQTRTRLLSDDQEETLSLYSRGEITAREAKADVGAEVGCDSRELISLLAQRGLTLPRVSLSVADTMARDALALLNIPAAERRQPEPALFATDQDTLDEAKAAAVEDLNRPKYKLADLMNEMDGRLPMVEGWDTMKPVGPEAD